MVKEAREGVCSGATADRHITAEGTSQLSPSKCLSRVQLEQDQAALLTSAKNQPEWECTNAEADFRVEADWSSRGSHGGP
ncbi:hypothetical protein CHARACLAT_003569 [Characodon lateralis]|uniref:Uncharacterized protein n=1 Tax=Characodon lateralis TaxID=208331 RepID=A0ABU7DS13_9TELE|nr:hypothetical protein [Characodon lateralis]